MSPRDLVYVGHMLDMARKAVDKTTGLARDAYDADENLRLALTHLIQVIGEAARHVSRGFTVEHPQISWADIVGMRHKVVHDYLGVDEDIVWQTLQTQKRQISVFFHRGDSQGESGSNFYLAWEAATSQCARMPRGRRACGFRRFECHAAIPLVLPRRRHQPGARAEGISRCRPSSNLEWHLLQGREHLCPLSVPPPDRAPAL